MKLNLKENSIFFQNLCPNCKGNLPDEINYEHEIGVLPLSDVNEPIHVIHVICKKCGYIRTFCDPNKYFINS